jgi:hypothetical protein
MKWNIFSLTVAAAVEWLIKLLNSQYKNCLRKVFSPSYTYENQELGCDDVN